MKKEKVFNIIKDAWIVVATIGVATTISRNTFPDKEELQKKKDELQHKNFDLLYKSVLTNNRYKSVFMESYNNILIKLMNAKSLDDLKKIEKTLNKIEKELEED